MNQPQLKPKYLTFTENWTTKAGFVWCTIFSVIGVTFIGITEGIATPLMTILMLFVGKWMIKFLLSIQISNKLVSHKAFDFVILFFWAAGVYGFIYFLIQGAFGQFAEPEYAYFYFAASIFPLGASLGAAEKWNQRFGYE